MSADFVEGALARGDIAFGAFDRGRLVCYTWRALGATPDVEDVWVTFGAPYHYGYKAFTRPSHRGRRLLVAVSFFSDSYLLERGHAKRLTFTGICNFASLASQKAAGSRKIGIAGYIRLFGVFIPYRTSAVKAVGFAFVRTSDRSTRKG